MKKVKLSTLKDGQPFIRNQQSQIAYTVTKKVKGGVMFTAVVSDITYTKKASTLVFINA